MSDWPSAYACIDLSGLSEGRYSLRPLDWADREPIRIWRNEQIDILRQPHPLTAQDQDRYYESVVRAEMVQEHPRQILAALEYGGELIGYGGLVHISWENRRAEVSFITATQRQAPAQFRADLRAFFLLVASLAQRAKLHRLTTETYEFRQTFLEELARAGFVEEGRYREHVWIDDRFIDSIAHGLILPRANPRE